MEIHIADEREKEAVLALRFEVFVTEQQVPPEIELDREDEFAIHIIAYEDGMVIGCGRIVLAGDNAHMGRIAVKKEYRNRGVGTERCTFIIEYCLINGIRRIWLNSQFQAIEFYKKLGFIPKSKIFTEAGIEHIRMEIIK